MAMKCPKCKTVFLKPTMVKNTDVELDFCPDCRGLWLDGGEFEQISKYAMKDLSIPGEAQEKPLICPRCDVPMYQFVYPQTPVVIEMCEHCRGLWCDSGELVEIENIRKQLKELGALREYDRPSAAIHSIKDRFLQFLGNYVEIEK